MSTGVTVRASSLSTRRWEAMRENWSRFRESRIGIIGLGIILLFALMAVAQPILLKTVWPARIYDPVTGFAFGAALQPAPPSLAHLLGTDPLGRDILSQLMYSARTEFALGLTAAVVTVVVGTVAGAVAAYFEGVVDALLMRLADLVIMMPAVSLLAVLSALYHLNVYSLAVVIGLMAGLGGTAVVLKSQAMSIKVRPYVEAARTAGGGPFHILRVHVIPGVLPLSLLYMMFTVTAAIFSEAVLSYFGLLEVPMSWGIMVHTAESGGYLADGLRYWWLLVPAGASISLLCGSFYLVGRALDDLFNPRLRGR